MKNQIKAALFGVAVGDALGVPVEFKSRSYLRENPVTEMMGYLCWNQPPGTWSDDSSLTFCLAESLSKGYDIEQIGEYFVKWMQEGYWGAHYKLFDIGGSTRHSLFRISKGESARFAGDLFEESNGNGSLMRILPLVFLLHEEENLEVIIRKVREISSITHAHFRSVFACFIYIIYANELLKGLEKKEAYAILKGKVRKFAKNHDFNPSELELFSRILEGDIQNLEESEIHSSGYVLHSLEASLWCLLNSNSYQETVLKAVNLGGDTDTTGAIAGGLAGLLYGFDAIPKEWVNTIARKSDIDDLCERFYTQVATKY
jgi:ADP-ribosylglycohydrolase